MLITCEIFHLRIVLMLVYVETYHHTSEPKEHIKLTQELKSRIFIVLKDHDKWKDLFHSF